MTLIFLSLLLAVCHLQYVEKMKIEILENLRHLAHAPGVQFEEVAPDSMLPDYELPDIPSGNTTGNAGAEGYMERIGRYAHEHGVIRPNELYEGKKDNWGD